MPRAGSGLKQKHGSRRNARRLRNGLEDGHPAFRRTKDACAAIFDPQIGVVIMENDCHGFTSAHLQQRYNYSVRSLASYRS